MKDKEILMQVREACEKNEILKNANPSSMAKMVSYGMLREYRKGETIFREREEVTKLYFLVEGCVALYRINRNQDRKVIFVLGHREMLNEVILQEPVASISCMALTDVKILSFTRRQFKEIVEQDFELSARVMDSLAKKLRRCYHQLSNTPNAMRLDRQVASKLWKLGRDFGQEKDGQVKICFELSITFLADMVGAKRETVSRVVKKLSDEGLIEVKKNYFYLSSLEELREYVLSVE